MTQKAYTFIDHTAGLRRLKYWLHLPPTYFDEPQRRWPLILFLHGRGERGNDLALVKKYAIPKLVEDQPDFPFIAVSPQCPLDTEWPLQTETLTRLLDVATTNLLVDLDRVYLTGLSMGGRGSWLLAVEQPQRFAALVPICGRIPTDDFLERVPVLKTLPTWVFHGAKDPVVPVENSEKIVAALKAAGGNVQLTIYPEADHDSWTATYNNPKLYEWLLAQRRGS